MKLLEQQITYEQLLAWGAGSLFNERHLRRWFSGKEKLTVSEVLRIPTNPSRIFWLIMREQVIPEKLIHQMAIELCRRFLDRLQEKRIYIDFRSRKALDVKRAWLEGQVSLGEYMSAQRKAMQASYDVSELQDTLVSAGAVAACEASLEQPREAFRLLYYTISDVFNSNEDAAELLQAVENSLAAYGA